MQRKKKQEDVKPLPDNTLTAQRTTSSLPKPAAKLILEVFERNGSTIGARLAVYEKLVTDLGATTWEELALGAELNRAVYLVVKIENLCRCWCFFTNNLLEKARSYFSNRKRSFVSEVGTSYREKNINADLEFNSRKLLK